MRAALGDGVRLAFGTFTALPLPAPRTVDRAAARAALLLAPVVGVALGLAAAAVHLAGRLLEGGGHGYLLASAVTVGALALATRAVHLDGLADTVDGLGVRRGRAAALAAMRDPHTGSFAVVALVLVLLLQVLALDRVTGEHEATGALVLAVTTGRAAAALACTSGVPAARPDGLGAAFAGCLPRPAALVVAAVPLAVAAGWALLDVDARPVQQLLAAALGMLTAGGLLGRCVRRFGGITGDVLGALVETATTTVLLVLALSPDLGAAAWHWPT